MQTDKLTRSKSISICIGMIVLFLSTFLDAFSQTVKISEHSARSTTERMTIDGILNESSWMEAKSISEFIQFQPVEGALATRSSEVKVVYGTDALYIGATLYDDEPDKIEASLGRRDVFNRADWFWFSVDSYFDRKTAYIFGVNAAGIQLDAIQTSGRRTISTGSGGPSGDLSWDGIWTSKPRLTHEGWTVEIAIPFSMLRFPEVSEQTWGIQFSRSIPRLGEESEWPYIPRAERINRVANFGRLTELRGLKPKRNIQISPYALSRIQRNEDSDNLGNSINSSGLDLGGDLKISLGPNISLDATLNPDFGQVESDPSVLNLTAFETVFQERRPFFLEGSQIFDFDVAAARLPYTRRIGSMAPIIGALKLSGRTQKGLSFGLLGASSGEDFDPSRSYAVARVTQQIGAFSRIGAMVTGFDGPVEDADGRIRSTFIGADYDFRFFENSYSLEGFIGMADRRQTMLDGSGTRGFGAKFLGRRKRGSLTGLFGIEGFGDDFEINDIGLLRSNNFVAIPLLLNYDLNEGQGFGPFLRASIRDFAIQNFSVTDGLDQGQRHSIAFSGLMKSFRPMSLGLSIQAPLGGYSIVETRGLGPWARPFGLGFSAGLGTDQRRSWQITPELGLTNWDNGGREYEIEIEGSWSAGPRISWSGSVAGSWENDYLAWTSNELFSELGDSWFIGQDSNNSDLDDTVLTAFDDGGQLASILSQVEPLEGPYYYVPVFGTRNTRSLDFTLRNTLTLAPNFSIQFYGQFFLAKGQYESFQILQNRDDLVDFGSFPKRDEFSLSSLQTNAVLRWEYRPGSTVFLVWTHNRNVEDVLNPLSSPSLEGPYARNLSGQFSDTFDRIPTNVVLVKASYTFLN